MSNFEKIYKKLCASGADSRMASLIARVFIRYVTGADKITFDDWAVKVGQGEIDVKRYPGVGEHYALTIVRFLRNYYQLSETVDWMEFEYNL